MIDQSIRLFGHRLLYIEYAVVGLVWLGFVGTSSDSIPPTTSSRAPPSNNAEGGMPSKLTIPPLICNVCFIECKIRMAKSLYFLANVI